jgi:hypothetical protein
MLMLCVKIVVQIFLAKKKGRCNRLQRRICYAMLEKKLIMLYVKNFVCKPPASFPVLKSQELKKGVVKNYIAVYAYAMLEKI